MHSKLKALIPHGVEGITVDGLGAKVGTVDRHAQDIHLDAGAAAAVSRTDVLPRNNLREYRGAVILVSNIISSKKGQREVSHCLPRTTFTLVLLQLV